jgi:uncharacterized protein
VIFVDSNVPMYLVGEPHRHKADALAALERLALERRRLVTSAEVFQEILHRYTFLRRLDAIQPAFDALRAVVEEVLPVTDEDAESAKALVLERRGLSASDALHVAVMRHHGIESILSFDTGFDRVPGIRRVGE